MSNNTFGPQDLQAQGDSLWVSERGKYNNTKVIWAHTPTGEKYFSRWSRCKYWIRGERYSSKLLEDSVHMRHPTIMDWKPLTLPSASIFLPRRYTRKYSDLQITSIRDVGSCGAAKCDIGHYLVCMMNWQKTLNYRSLWQELWKVSWKITARGKSSKDTRWDVHK
jgi:hypothetical protein